MEKLLQEITDLGAKLETIGAAMVAEPRFSVDDFRKFANSCFDMGLDVPDVVKNDHRYHED